MYFEVYCVNSQHICNILGSTTIIFNDLGIYHKISFLWYITLENNKPLFFKFCTFRNILDVKHLWYFSKIFLNGKLRQHEKA
jgi:hypothetical protein